jgi:hypothetical protein
MEIDLFTILILIFLFFPLIRRIFEGLKGKSQQPEKAQSDAEPWARSESDGMQETTTRTARTETPQHQKRGEQTWEDFFEGLEQVISGDDPARERSHSAESADRSERPARAADRQPAHQASRSERRHRDESVHRHPSHGPIHGSERGSGKSSAPANPFSYRGATGSEIGVKSDLVNRELTEGDNPIYQDLDETPEVVVIDDRGRPYIKRMLKDPEKLRDGILIKEILDPPKSRRSNQNRF